MKGFSSYSFYLNFFWVNQSCTFALKSNQSIIKVIWNVQNVKGPGFQNRLMYCSSLSLPSSSREWTGDTQHPKFYDTFKQSSYWKQLFIVINWPSVMIQITEGGSLKTLYFDDIFTLDYNISNVYVLKICKLL